MNLPAETCTNRPSLPSKDGISRNIVGVAEAVPKPSYLRIRNFFIYPYSCKDIWKLEKQFIILPCASWFNKPRQFHFLLELVLS